VTRAASLAAALLTASALVATAAPDATLHDLSLTALDGTPFDAAALRGKVVLVVNVASQCGLTPQYEKLEALHRRFKDRGLVLVGVPSNDFGGQEPGTPEEIREFCTSRFEVTFPLLSKTKVLGDDKAPLYRFLTASNPAFQGEVRWNFTKFLVDREGRVIGRFEPRTDPLSDDVVRAIEAALGPG
jgi:glutathione peroxidase